MKCRDFNSYRVLLMRGLASFEKFNSVSKFVKVLRQARKKKSTIFLAGNGGSAATANHFATDLTCVARAEGGEAFRAHSICANPSTLTCLANDMGYENIFSSQLEALAASGDILVVFSGSGNSPNILKALQAAHNLNVFSVALLGFDGGQAKAMSDLALHFPIDDMQVAEDLHMIICHFIIKAI